jgi:hypothetical protein
MFSKIKKPKMIDGSGREFQKRWKKTYSVTDRNGKASCILCSESVVIELC